MKTTRTSEALAPATDRDEDEEFEELLNRSSLGAPRARMLRCYTPQDICDLLQADGPRTPAGSESLLGTRPAVGLAMDGEPTEPLCNPAAADAGAAGTGSAAVTAADGDLLAEVAATIQAGRTGSTMPRMLLGLRLRKHREASGITRAQAADAIRASQAKLCRMELGRTGVRIRDVTELITFYGVSSVTERADLLELAGQANAANWWHPYQDLLQPWVQAYLGFEQAASLIRNYELQFVPGLLQTADYARSVIQLGHPDPATAARLVELRMQRQQILHTPGPARLWVVIDEAVLHRPFCTAPAMRAQIQHLIAMSELPHITIQVLPFRNGGRVAAGGPVVLLRFPNNEISDVVYLEQLASAVVLDKHADVSRYLFVMNCLATEAEEQEESRAMLRRILKDS